MRKIQELAGRSVGFQQTILHQVVRIRCVIHKAVHLITDVIEDVGRQLGKNVVPFVLRGHNMRAAKNGFRLLEPPFGLLGSKASSLTGMCSPDVLMGLDVMVVVVVSIGEPIFVVEN